MTNKKKEKPKTTINIAPADMGPLGRLALEMGFKWARQGNVTKLLQHLIKLVKDFGPRVVAEALAQENLAALAEALGQETE